MNNILASYWIAAWHQEEEVLAKIKQAFVTLPSGTILLLDGVCRYVGPGVVFQAEWDTSGAMQLLYRDPTLRANVWLNPRLRLTPDSVILPMYEDESAYPYGDRLLVYDVAQNRSFPLTNFQTAREYIRSAPREARCPPGREGKGTPVF